MMEEEEIAQFRRMSVQYSAVQYIIQSRMVIIIYVPYLLTVYT